MGFAVLIECNRQETAGLARIDVVGDVTTYRLDPAHFTQEVADAIAELLNAVEPTWIRHGDPARPDAVDFRVLRRGPDELPASTPVLCVSEPGLYAFALSSEHVTEEGCAALDAAARVELANWSQR